MHRKLVLMLDTLFTGILFLGFHVLLAVTGLCYFVFLAPWILLRRLMDAHNDSPIGGFGLGQR